LGYYNIEEKKETKGIKGKQKGAGGMRRNERGKGDKGGLMSNDKAQISIQIQMPNDNF